MSNYSYIRLIFAVYKVTELFPAKERLKRDIRNSADSILVGLINSNFQGCVQEIDHLYRLFDLTEERNLVDARNFLVLRQEYDKIKEFASKNQLRISSGKLVEKSSPVMKRQEEILTILKSNGKTKIGQLVKSFPDTNRRTLLRDLDNFCRIGLIEKNGNGRGVCYTIRNATL